MTKQVVIHANATMAKFHSGPSAAETLIAKALQYSVPTGASKVAWVSMYNYKTQLFPAGFLPMVQKKLTDAGFKANLLRQTAPEPMGPAVRECVVDDFEPDERYDYLFTAVDKLLATRAMTAKIATGGAKSTLAKLSYAALKLPTLFLTTRTSLAHQMQANIQKGMGIRAGIIGDSKFDPRHFTVATVQSIAPYLKPYSVQGEVESAMKAAATARGKKMSKGWDNITKVRGLKGVAAKREYEVFCNALERMPTLADLHRAKEAAKKKFDARRQRILKFLASVEFIIGEEAQDASSTQYYDTAMACKNAHYRLALTATPGLSQNDEANMRLYAAFGLVRVEVTEAELIEKGILAKPYFKFVDTGIPKELHYNSGYQTAYNLGIVENAGRNAAIVQEALWAKKHNLPCLILVLRKKHGQILEKMLAAARVRAVFIQGSDNQAVREKVLSGLEKGLTVIGSKIADVGIDIPVLGILIIAGSGKSEGNHRQRIGRALRAKRTGKNVAYVVDFSDSKVKCLAEHALQRKAVIESTDGFKQGLLAKGEVFKL